MQQDSPPAASPVRTFTKKKLELFIEVPASRLALEALRAAGARGHTVLPILSGRGEGGPWDSLAVTDAGSHVLIVTVVGEEVAARAVAGIGQLLEDYHGIITVSTVEVLRSQRF
jgi:PII-like signaling protein